MKNGTIPNILHLDGDAFFVSVVQAINPALKGKPVVTGAERGIATAVSYEAKKYGVKRGMPIFEIKKRFPFCIVVNSDYEVYGRFSRRMFSILRSFSPAVEEYSIDEGFADLAGLQKPREETGLAIKKTVETSLDISVSVGISLTKSLAKLASSSCKPSGFAIIDAASIEKLLKKTPIQDVWGIGKQTSERLQKQGIKTAYQFTKLPKQYILSQFSKPFFDIWRELHGEKIFEIQANAKTTYKSMVSSETVTPPTKDADILWNRILIHVENTFERARRFGYTVGKLSLFLKTQKFQYHTQDMKLEEPIAYPLLIRKQLKKTFDSIYKKNTLYRTTGCTIYDLIKKDAAQRSLFYENSAKEEKIKKIYPLIESGKVNFGNSIFKPKKIINSEF